MGQLKSESYMLNMIGPQIQYKWQTTHEFVYFWYLFWLLMLFEGFYFLGYQKVERILEPVGCFCRLFEKNENGAGLT